MNAAERKTLVYDIGSDTTIAVPVSEARAGMIRYARSLGPGSPACGVVEARALDMSEITVAWGEDTICSTCLTPLPAGAPAWRDRDALLCLTCAEDVAA